MSVLHSRNFGAIGNRISSSAAMWVPSSRPRAARVA